MKCLAPALAAAFVLLAPPGCALMDSSVVRKISRDQQSEENVSHLADVRSIKEIDDALATILPGDAGQRNVERMIEGWGKHGSWYDLAVVRYLRDDWPSGYGHYNHINVDRVIPLIAKRVQEQPDLLRQAFWYEQWMRNGIPFKGLCQLCQHPGHSCVCVEGEEFPLILIIAGALNEPQWVYYCDRKNIEASWHAAGMEFLANRPFLRFDKERGIFVVDREAARENRYLKPEEQEPIPPPTPLPNWDSEMIPTVPPRS